MPYKRKYRKRKPRTYPRRYRKKRRRRLPETGFPMSKLVKLKYVTEIQLDAASNAVAVHNFMSNGIFDPDVTGVGHQPLGHDQWASVYDRYTVVGAKIKATPIATSSAGLSPSYYGVILQDSSDALSTPSMSPTELLEQKLTSNGPKTFGSTISNNAGTRTVSAVKHFSAKKFFGTKSVTGSGSAYSADFGASPVEQVYFTVWSASAGGNNPTSFTMNVEIEYICLLQQPVTLARS